MDPHPTLLLLLDTLTVDTRQAFLPCTRCLQVRLATRQLFREERRLPQAGSASVGSDGRLMLGTAVGTREDDKRRVDALREHAGVDAVILDSSQGGRLYRTCLVC